MNKRTLIRWFQLFGAVALIYLLLPGLSHAERVKDVASVAGVRGNQVVGYGLVVGLNGTGDQTTQAPFTIQSIANMLAKFGVIIPPSVAAQMQLKNVAAVTRDRRICRRSPRPDRPSTSRWRRSPMPPACAAARC